MKGLTHGIEGIGIVVVVHIGIVRIYGFLAVCLGITIHGIVQIPVRSMAVDY